MSLAQNIHFLMFFVNTSLKSQVGSVLFMASQVQSVSRKGSGLQYVSNQNGERCWEARGVSVWLHLFGTHWSMGFADAPFETVQMPSGVKPRAAAGLNNAWGMG